MSTAPFVELAFSDLPGKLRAPGGAHLGTPREALESGLMSFRLLMINHAKTELAKKADINGVGLLQILDFAGSLYLHRLNRFIGPAVAASYLKAYQQAGAGDVPMEVIYALAEQHSARTSKYFHESSTEALNKGFNSFVNRRVPAKAAANQVLDSFGLTSRQMSGVSALLPQDKVLSSLPRDLKSKISNYIGTSIRQRLSLFAKQEEHNISTQAQQTAWMWMQENDLASDRAQKMWMTAQDEKVCKVCGPLHRKKVLVTEQFELSNGAKLYVPGAHVNCRCEVRLMDPLVPVKKFYDPSQPRGADGRWSGGISDYRILGNKLNAMDTVSAAYANHKTTRFTRQVGRYVVSPRHILTPLSEKDREMLRIARGAMTWSSSGVGVDRVRKMSKGDQEYIAGNFIKRGSDKAINLMLKSVESVSQSAPELYRGMSITADHLDELKPGTMFELPLSSFSADMKLSRTFAEKWGPLIARNRARREKVTALVADNPVLMVVEPGSASLNISPIVTERNAEWVSKGKYLISAVEKAEGLTVVHLKQLSNKTEIFKAAVFRPREHPRDRGGRFTEVEESGTFPDLPKRQEQVAKPAEKKESEGIDINLSELSPVGLGININPYAMGSIDIDTSALQQTEPVATPQKGIDIDLGALSRPSEQTAPSVETKGIDTGQQGIDIALPGIDIGSTLDLPQIYVQQPQIGINITQADLESTPVQIEAQDHEVVIYDTIDLQKDPVYSVVANEAPGYFHQWEERRFTGNKEEALLHASNLQEKKMRHVVKTYGPPLDETGEVTFMVTHETQHMQTVSVDYRTFTDVVKAIQAAAAHEGDEAWMAEYRAKDFFLPVRNYQTEDAVIEADEGDVIRMNAEDIGHQLGVDVDDFNIKVVEATKLHQSLSQHFPGESPVEDEYTVSGGYVTDDTYAEQLDRTKPPIKIVRVVPNAPEILDKFTTKDPPHATDLRAWRRDPGGAWTESE